MTMKARPLRPGMWVNSDSMASRPPAEAPTAAPAPELDPDDLWADPDRGDWADEVVRGEG